jgi:outer membrane protein assembly factor BamB
MDKIGKTFALFLILIMAFSCLSLLMVKPASAQTTDNTAAFTRTLLWNSSNDLVHSFYLVKNVAYLSTENGTVYALDVENANVLWSFNAYFGVSSSDIQTLSIGGPSLRVSDGIVYIGSITDVYAVNASTGDTIWKSPTPPIYSVPAVVDGVIFIGSSDNSVYAFNASNGIELWHCILGSSFFLILGSPVVSNGVVFIGSMDSYVYAINATAGVQLWYYDTGSIDSTPKVANGVVYINNEAGDYFALNATNGDKLDIDSNIISDIISSPSTVVGHDKVFISAQLYDNTLCSINASDNARIWSSNIFGIESSPIVIDGIVCVVGAAVNGDVLYALNVTNGDQLWTYPLWTNQNGGINLLIFTYVNGILYVQPYGGNLYAYNISSVLPSSLDISVLSPKNERYVESSVPLVFSVSNAVSWIGYSLDGKQNITVTGNTTIANLPNGFQTLTIFANDTYGNVASQTVNFTVEKPQNGIVGSTVIIAVTAVPVVVICLIVGLLFYRRHRKTANLKQ